MRNSVSEAALDMTAAFSASHLMEGSNGMSSVPLRRPAMSNTRSCPPALATAARNSASLKRYRSTR